MIIETLGELDASLYSYPDKVVYRDFSGNIQAFIYADIQETSNEKYDDIASFMREYADYELLCFRIEINEDGFVLDVEIEKQEEENDT